MADRLKLGVIVELAEEASETINEACKLGVTTCQVSCWDHKNYTDANARVLKDAQRLNDIKVTTVWGGYPGPLVWNFLRGPATIGLVPLEFRQARVDALKAGAEFAKLAGAPSLTTHAGFVPEDPGDPLYVGTIEALTEVATYCKELGLAFHFETGQETPITLLRLMRDIGTDNLGVNLDPANLLMYGKANAVDSLDILGPYVRGVHAKDGEYPTDPVRLGMEKLVGEGRVDWPALIPKLKSFGYTGAITIEREITGEQWVEDIKCAIERLTPLL